MGEFTALSICIILGVTKIKLTLSLSITKHKTIQIPFVAKPRLSLLK